MVLSHRTTRPLRKTTSSREWLAPAALPVTRSGTKNGVRPLAALFL
jgi:hypothetical protein